VTEHTIWSKFL